MKKSVFILLLSVLFYPFLSNAQNHELEVEMNSHQCDNTNNFDAATGCDYWLSNANGDTVYQDVVPSFTQNWSFSVPYNSTEAPYFVNFDHNCLNSNGVVLDNYTLQVHNIHAVGNDFWADSVMICESTPSNTVDYSTSIYSCDTTAIDPMANAAGCDYWVEDGDGNIVLQNHLPTATTYQNGSGYIHYYDDFNFVFDSSAAPYSLFFNENCLLSQGVVMDLDSIVLNTSPNNGPNEVYDSLYVCAHTEIEDSIWATVYSNCDSTTDLSLAAGCDYWITNSNEHIVYQNHIPTSGSWSFLFPYDAAQHHYFINFDDSCLNLSGVVLDNYTIEITNIHPGYYEYEADSIKVCDNNTSNNIITYSGLIYTDGCDSIPNANNSLAIGCDYWVEDANGIVISQYTINSFSGNNYIGSFDFDYDSLVAPYSLNFDQNCLNNNGLLLDDYSIPLNKSIIWGNAVYDTLEICAYYDSTIVNDSCADLYSNVGPWIGYYQNYTNYINFQIGNNSNTSQQVTVEIVIPPNVTPVFTSSNFPYNVSGSILTLNTTLPAQTSYMDVIKFNVPGGISDGTLHNYGISIYNNNPTINDCNQWNNQDTLHQVVGNSYDPNAKTVSLPEKIATDTQDEFLYTIYFQNTGTAPAKDIYLMDTLSDNLDWSTFEFVRASHVVGISDLGNGVRKFYFNGIWLPDSSSNLAKSNGFVAFKIKEKSDNSVGSEVFNTAYIYFDQNAPIETNKTYNINVDNLGLEDLAKEINVKLFPNPANASINIEAENRIDNITIYSVDGKLVWSSEPNQSEVKLNISNFNSGLYLVKVQSQESIKTLRFIKK